MRSNFGNDDKSENFYTYFNSYFENGKLVVFYKGIGMRFKLWKSSFYKN